MEELKELMELTGITVKALARKVNARAEEIEDWLEGSSSPSWDQKNILLGFWKKTQVKEALDGPRIVCPRLTSQVVCEDSTSYIDSLPEKSVDLFLSDIPYGIGLDGWDVLHKNTNSAYLGSSDAQKKAGSVFKRRSKPINGWSSADKNISEEYGQWCDTWTPGWYKALKPGGSVFIFAGRRYAHRCIVSMEKAGFNFKDMISWIRPKAAYRAQRLSVVYQKRGEIAEANKWEGWRLGNLRPVFEPILWFFKPYKNTLADNMLDYELGAINAELYKQSNGSYDNVIMCGSEGEDQGHHEAQKPIKLLQRLIELTTVEGQMVVDPFAGSGSTAIAALRSNRAYLMVDRDQGYCNTMNERIQKENK